MQSKNNNNLFPSVSFLSQLQWQFLQYPLAALWMFINYFVPTSPFLPQSHN